MQAQAIRNVSNKEIYDSYMGIIRISPNPVGEELLDDTTVLLKTLKTKDGQDNKVILSDSDGNQLGIYFVPRARKTLVINELSSEQIRDVVNFIVKTDDAFFVTKSFNVRSTLFVDNSALDNSVRSVQVFSKARAATDVFDVVVYPIESPYSDEYFNDKNNLSLIDYSSSTPVDEQLEESLKEKTAEWYVTNIDNKHKVKINGEYIMTSNKHGEKIPVLYTHDYVMGHYSGHTARVSESLTNKFLGSSIALNKLTENSSLISKLSYIRVDDVIWERLSYILNGDKRHIQGRYTKLGLGKSDSITEHLFGIIAPNLNSSAPILGAGVPFGGISYNAMSFKRYMFNCLRQEIKNKHDAAENGGSALEQDLQKLVNDGAITEAKKKEEGFSSEMAQKYILCNGKEITPENYPNAYTDNPSLYVVDDNGFAQRGNNGLPQLNANNEIIQAIQSSDKSSKFKTPSLFSFEMSAMRFLRGLNWTTNISKDKPVDLREDIKEGMFSNNEFDIEILEDSDFGTTKKNFCSVGSYRAMYDFKLVNTKHKHYCFSSSNGEPVSNGGDPMYPNKSLTSQMITGKYMSVDETNTFWKDLFTYSFTKERSTINETEQPQSLLYGCQPIRIAGKFAWRIKDGGDMEENFEEDVQKGLYFINDKDLTQISFDKNERKAQLLHMNKAESVAPVSYIGNAGLITSCTWGIFKCRKHVHWKHENFLVCKNHGGYKVMQANGGVKRCVTSLPMSLEEITDKNYNGENNKDVYFSGNKVSMDISLPNPPALSFLPLMKIA